MIALAWGALSVLGAVLLAALGDLASEEIRGWLDLAPHAILRLAATRLPRAQRQAIYHDEWLPELCYVLRGTESRPITRLLRATTFATGLLIASRRIARLTSPPPAATPARSEPPHPAVVTATATRHTTATYPTPLFVDGSRQAHIVRLIGSQLDQLSADTDRQPGG